MPAQSQFPVVPLGPDRANNVRLQRPYFLIPLDPRESRGLKGWLRRARDRAVKRFQRGASLSDLPPDAQSALDRVVECIKAAKQPFTDVIVFSHGWHRTFYTAVSGYDRLVSRFRVLGRRGRIDPNCEHRPLLLAVHWHSDPGADSFYDPDGRRDKASFLALAQQLFEIDTSTPPVSLPAPYQQPNFTRDFEDLFEFLSDISAPAGPTVIDTHYAVKEQSQHLYTRLTRYSVRDQVNGAGGPPDLVATLWRCYDESQAKGLLLDQDQKPGTYMWPWSAINKLLWFLVPIVGVPLLAWSWSKISGPLSAFASHGITDAYGELYDRLAGAHLWSWAASLLAGIATPVWAELRPLAHNSRMTFYVMGAAAAWLIPMANADVIVDTARKLLGLSSKQRTWAVSTLRGNEPFNVIAWLILQILFVAPLLEFCLLNYLLGFVRRRWLLWDERLGQRGKPLDLRDTPIRVTFFEAILYVVRWPLHLLICASASDSIVYRLATQIDAQLSVAEMQRRGAETGGRLALFLDRLYSECGEQLKGAELHMAGHSFGGVVVSNGARRLALDPQQTFVTRFRERCRFPFCSLAVIQGAMASHWFADEPQLLSAVRVLAAIYTRYDTATGFIYSFGFGSRLGVGNVGLDIPGRDIPTYGHRGEFASLTSPPSFDPPAPAKGPWTANMDASRFEYHGNPAAGGAHSDIYKDDLVNLLWAIFTVRVEDRIVGLPECPDHAVVNPSIIATSTGSADISATSTHRQAPHRTIQPRAADPSPVSGPAPVDAGTVQGAGDPEPDAEESELRPGG